MNKYLLIMFIFLPSSSYSNNNILEFSKTISIPFKTKVIIDKSNNQNFQKKEIIISKKNKIIVKKEEKINNEEVSLLIKNKENQISKNSLVIENEDFDSFIQRIEYIGFIEDKKEIKLFIKYNNILITPETGSTFEELYKIKNITAEKIFFLNIRNLSIYEYSLPKRSNYEQY